MVDDALSKQSSSESAPQQDSGKPMASNPHPLAPQNLDRDLEKKTVDLWTMSQKEYNEQLAIQRENRIREDAVKKVNEIKAMGFPSREDVEKFIANKLSEISLKEEKLDKALAEIEEIRERFRTPRNSGVLDGQLKPPEAPNPLMKWVK